MEKYDRMINIEELDKGFDYYNLNYKYKYRCYKCLKEISKNDKFISSFKKVFKQLNYDDFNSLNKCWNIKNIDEMFCENIDPFVTNLLIILSYNNHEKNMKKNKLNDKQVLIHKKRVKECFENDLIKRKYNSIRISQMLWAIYFIRVKIIEIGRLQYEYFEDEGKQLIKIHIPSGEILAYDKVLDSLKKSGGEIKKIFNINDVDYVCNSWLLSNEVNNIISINCNINKFYKLFNVIEGEECIDDILNFVYSLTECNDYGILSEETSLQKNIKEQLINGVTFKLGKGVLKKEAI
ncbi:MAG: hypothetical protein PUB18_02245 [bacterium]|nr:hypothetical protein [bacterium]